MADGNEDWRCGKMLGLIGGIIADGTVMRDGCGW